MTTLAQLKKFAKAHFTPAMAERGFTIGPNRPIYYRLVNDVYHMFWLDLDRSGKQVRVRVHAWVPEGQAIYDGRFPDGAAAYTGSYLRSGALDITPQYWNVDSAEAAEESFKEILRALDAIAIPWFSRISSREDLVRELRKEYDAFGNRIEDLILRKATPKKG